MFEIDKKTKKEKNCAYCWKKIDGGGFANKHFWGKINWCNEECYEGFFDPQNRESKIQYYKELELRTKNNTEYFYISIPILLLIFAIIMFVYITISIPILLLIFAIII